MLPPFDQRVVMQVACEHRTPLVILADDQHLEDRLADCFGGGDQHQDHQDHRHHHLPVLLLAWAYILSDRWAELVPDAQPLGYETFQAPIMAAVDDAEDFGAVLPDDHIVEHDDNDNNNENDDSTMIVVDVGSVDEEAARWWSAILCPGTGWAATILNDKGKVLHSPWSVTTESKHKFAISATVMPQAQSVRQDDACRRGPASFGTALGYLSRYCDMHGGLADMSKVALSAALFIPVAGYDRRRIRIPVPRRRVGCVKSRIPTRLRVVSRENLNDDPGTSNNNTNSNKDVTAWLNSEDDNKEEHGNRHRKLDQLLTLSCNPRGIKALLGSVVFEPGVECNTCGAWIVGSLAFLDSAEVTSDRKSRGRGHGGRLLRTLIARDPGLAFLWLGAFATGAEARCLETDVPAGWWKVDLDVAAWTSTHVSFIQEPVSAVSPARGTREVFSRADEARLLYLAHLPGHAVPPLLPFAPFGSTGVEDLDLDVRRHVQCGGLAGTNNTAHGLMYMGFTWVCLRGEKVTQEAVDDEVLFNHTAEIRFKAAGRQWQQRTPQSEKLTDGSDGRNLTSSRVVLPAVADPGNLANNDGNNNDDRDDGDDDEREHGDEVSEVVTRNMFTWLREEDGFPVAEKAIREHEWLNDLDSDDDDGDSV